MTLPPKIIIAAGGTGGHLFPAVSVAQAIRRLKIEADFLFVGTGRPVEDSILNPGGWKRATLKTSGLKGYGPLNQIKALWQCLLGVRESRRLIMEFKPQLCLTFGGYVTAPVALAARLAGLPLAIHEQNSRPGVTNRFLGRLARLVMVGFEEASNRFARHKVKVVGNPVRPEIAALHELKRVFGKTEPVILVTGGSQGAAALNRAVCGALVALKNQGRNLKVIHQTGKNDYETVKDAYQKAGLNHQAAPFFDQMAELYQEADLIICRAGALTLAEVAAAKLPSILVPLPTAADDHQTINARHLSENGAAVLLSQKNLDQLGKHISDLLGDPERLKNMSGAAGNLARLKADELMATLCLGLINRNAAARANDKISPEVDI